MVVAQSATSSFGYDKFLPIFGHFTQHLACVGIATHAAQRHFQYLVASGASSAEVLASVFAVFGKHVFGIFEVQERPALAVSSENDMSSPSAVASVGACFGIVFNP
jgi:hypothetical protein